MKVCSFFFALLLPLPTLSHQVIGITDGDTIKLLVDRREVKIRLANIDAPERKQAFGTRSGQSLSELCWGKDASYETQDIDRYKRVVAVVYCNGINVNRAQVERGYAWLYPKYNKDAALHGLQDAAKSSRKGLWEDQKPIPPWEWRRK